MKTIDKPEDKDVYLTNEVSVEIQGEYVFLKDKGETVVMSIETASKIANNIQQVIMDYEMTRGQDERRNAQTGKVQE